MSVYQHKQIVGMLESPIALASKHVLLCSCKKLQTTVLVFKQSTTTRKLGRKFRCINKSPIAASCALTALGTEPLGQLPAMQASDADNGLRSVQQQVKVNTTDLLRLSLRPRPSAVPPQTRLVANTQRPSRARGPDGR